MSRPILALVALGAAACGTAHPLSPAPAVISLEMGQLLKVRGALADYAKTDTIVIVRDEYGRPVSFRFNGR